MDLVLNITGFGVFQRMSLAYVVKATKHPQGVLYKIGGDGESISNLGGWGCRPAAWDRACFGNSATVLVMGNPVLVLGLGHPLELQSYHLG